ncbi:hypothetical protein [Nocardiopsis algeriensis]|uniref:Uncharacterized protein n=1 Tax=Nocardiopsis algeriensis TaxID=1478215 RepID=A0A841IV98_9ACTN|nr:hypothetical protein [Nocardiopsis algeriensis]MBB6122180.1 hypothetical protein [Nocardiopsis algeriensis]
MKLSEVYEAITESRPHDWKHIPLWAANTGAGFHQVWDKSEGENWELYFDRHTHQLVFQDNVALTIAWGIKYCDGMTPQFLEPYPSAEQAEVFFADVFWNGNLIHREPVYGFDSLEYVCLPAPKAVHARDEHGASSGVERYEVTPFQVSLVRLVHSAEHKGFDELFDRSGFVVTAS